MKKYNKLDIIKFYRRTHKNPLDISTTRRVLKKCNKYIIDKIYEGHMIRLPYNFGNLYVVRFQAKISVNEDYTIDFTKSTAGTDWGTTRKLWKEKPELANKIYLAYENTHTDGYKMRIKYVLRFASLKQLKVYNFKAARAFKRGLAKYISTNHKTDYYDN